MLAPWLPLLRREMEEVLAQAGVSPGFREELLSILRNPEGFFHPETSSPRSSLVFLFALGLCGRYEHVTPAGLAVELYLSVCDLLDSIEDAEGGASTGQAQALNQATGLLLLSNISLGRLWKGNEPAKAKRAAEFLEFASVRSCQGQSLDLAFESRETISEQECLQMVEWKAAAPVSCACSVGALLSTDEEETIEAAAQYGKWLGMAKQARNDALAIVSGETKSDIRRRKKTLPVIYTLDNAQGTDRDFLQSVYSAAKAPGPEAEARVRNIILEVGGVHYAMVVAEVYRQRAIEQIARTRVTPDIADRLRIIASF